MNFTPATGTRVVYLGDRWTGLGTIDVLCPDLNELPGIAFIIRWDNGFDDEGYWLSTDSNIRPVQS